MNTNSKSLPTYLIKGGTIINEGKSYVADILIKDGLIDKIDTAITFSGATEINAEGKYIIPGIIDDQVHFREPGLTHKACIGSEAKAAVAGGVTSFMEMPNTKPSALTQELLQDKYDIANRTSYANYSFFMGASNDNIEEVLKTNTKNVCGVKVFMGSSTGNMLVDDETTLRNLFAKVPMLIAAHCEDEATVRRNMEIYREKYGENVPMSCHPEIRNIEACYKSSSMGKALAEEFDTRFHILHISTEEELALFNNTTPLAEKRITSEVCVHHLYFSKDDYAQLGSKVKCNPAIKESRHKKALFKALLDDRLDIIATDHAPHTIEEKAKSYFNAPSGLPLVQHALHIMLDFYYQDMISLEKIVEKMCHAPAICFQLANRGFIREGYWADLAVVDINQPWQVQKENILYQCSWSPLEGKQFKSQVNQTFVSGYLAYDNGRFNDFKSGERLLFNR